MDAAAWCGHLVPQGSVFAFLADHRHRLFPPELFADVARQGGGHPSVPAEVIATVMVLQALEGLSDREAVSALRRDLAWKVACGLRLDDEGFHPTVLVYWRNRLRASPQPRRIFDAVGQVVEATGVLRGRGRRVLDSTVLADAVATQDTVTQLVAAIRRVRRLVPTARGVTLAAHDYDRPGKPECAWDDPQAKQALVSGLVNDALAVLAAVDELDLDAEQAEAVALLALVAGQDVEPGERPGTWRIARKVARDRVISTVDPQARHARKTSARRRDGYKGHVAVEPETGLVTECALTAATAADGPTGVGLLAGEPPGLEVLGDTHYGSGQTRAALRAAGHSQTIKPIPLASAVPGGFTIHDFGIDQPAGTASCPAGHQARITASGKASFARWCQRCPLRGRCTTAKDGRTIGVHPHDDELRAARRRATTRSFQQSYRRWRPMVERSIAWLVADGCRRVPYRGIERNDLWWSLRVAAVNLRRLLALGLARHDDAWALA
ncbi:MAG: family transposase [Actinomycetia bacterium]|nr:family transposase [Actinomycetes bacterium]